MNSRILWCLTAAASVSLACSTTPDRPTGTGKAVRVLPQGMTVDELQRDRYGDDEARRPAPEDLVAIVDDALQARGRADVTHDPLLDDLAAAVATTLAEQAAFPVATLLQWTMWQAGVTGRITELAGDHGPSSVRDQELDAALRRRVDAFDDKGAGEFHYGVARVESKGGVGQVFVVVEDACRLTAVEKKVMAGSRQTVRGRCAVKVDEAALYVTDDATKVRRVDVEIDPQGAFEIAFDAPTQPGEHFVELSGVFDDEPAESGGQWRRTLLHFPIAVDVELPKEPDETIRAPRPNPGEAGEWPALVVTRLNEARAAAGVGPLTVDPKVAALAQQNVEKDTADRFHSMNIHAEMAKDGMPLRDGHVIAGRTEFIEESLWSTLLVPSMRDSILDAELSHVGVAFSEPDEHGVRSHRYLFVAPVGRLDAGVERARFVKRIARASERAGKTPPASDEALHAIVQAHAERVCRGEHDAENSEQLAKDLHALKRPIVGAPSLRSLHAPYVDPRRAPLVKTIATSDATAIGIGVCQGTVKGETNRELVVTLAIQES